MVHMILVYYICTCMYVCTLYCFPVYVGIFKNNAEPDVIVDLKGIVSLWRREVSVPYFPYNNVCLFVCFFLFLFLLSYFTWGPT